MREKNLRSQSESDDINITDGIVSSILPLLYLGHSNMP